MNMNQLAIEGPFTFENLSLFLFVGRDVFDGSRFIPLDQAMEQKCVVVHETGTVGELEIENLSDVFDLYVQAGDVVKGGRQDRTLGVDFVLPPKSGRVPVPSFCVESGRWHRRAAEEAGSFSSSKSSLSSKKLRMAAKMSKSQGEVWAKVAETQNDLNASLETEVSAAASPTSYQLAVEHEDLLKRKDQYRARLSDILNGKAEARGFAFAINGAINTADVYGSAVLFRQVWSKLLDAAIIEAIAETHREKGRKPRKVSEAAIREWCRDAEQAAVSDRQNVPPRVRVETRRSEKSVLFDTSDHSLGDVVLHRNLILA